MTNKTSVKIVDPDELMIKVATDSLSEIQKLFPTRIVEHVGASAVPIVGRKEIDIMMVSPNVPEDSKVMESTDYSAGPNVDGVSYFRKLVDDIEIGVQLVPENHAIIKIHRGIIEKLRSNPILKEEYSRFKYSLDGLTPDEYKSMKSAWIKKNLL